MRERFAVVVVGAPGHGADPGAALVAPPTWRRWRALSAGGGSPPPGGGRARRACFLVATGGSERALLDLWGGEGPLFLLAHPGHNSLPAALEALAAVRRQGGRGRILYLDGPGDDAGRAAVVAAVDDLEAAAALRRARLGLVGPPSDWLVASRPDPGRGAPGLGPRGGCGGHGAFPGLLPGRRRGGRRRAEGWRPPCGPWCGRNASTRVTVRCFDLIGALEATACLALSSLNDEGVVAGCEGDVPSALAMLWVRRLLGTAFVDGQPGPPRRLGRNRDAGALHGASHPGDGGPGGHPLRVGAGASPGGGGAAGAGDPAAPRRGRPGAPLAGRRRGGGARGANPTCAAPRRP